MVSRSCLAAVLCLGAVAAQEPQEVPRTGAIVMHFDQRHPLGKMAEQRRRFGWSRREVKSNDPAGGEYEIGTQTFRAYVPAGYRAGAGYGLLVWVSPYDRGRIPAAWQEVLAAHRLIGIGADDAGNQRLVWYRIALALDAVHNMTKRYHLDRRRIYVTGFSGGGRVASRLGMVYADVFTGGIYQGGCGYFRALKVPGDPSREWPARFPAPKGGAYRLAKHTSRHVITAGAEDPNAIQSKAIYEQLRRHDHFTHVTWLEMPGVGHTAADAACLAKAIAALDAPLDPK